MPSQKRIQKGRCRMPVSRRYSFVSLRRVVAALQGERTVQ
jgi:hypothetical protein